MSWNEPGRGNRDPWGGGGGSGNQGPPDLDEVINKVRGKLGGLLGSGGGSGSGRGSGDGGDAGGGGGAGISGKGIGLIAGVAFLVWMASGIYIIDEGFRGLELRFGEYQRTTGPGPHWRPPYPIGSVERVNVEERRVATVGYEVLAGDRRRKIDREALMLTRDENIVEVQIAVQYQVGESLDDARNYRFNFRDPDDSLRKVAESAVREVVGRSSLEFVLTEGRAAVAEEVFELASRAMLNYLTGLRVISVDIQDIQAPDEVQAAFEDVIMAREDAQRVINQATAYANQVIPEARGQSARVREDAEGFRARTVNEATGESERFLALLREYQRAPEVTRDRIYVDVIGDILERNRKILIDPEVGDPMLFLPLDRSGEPGSSSDSAARSFERDLLERRLPAAAGAASSGDARSRGDLRTRGVN